MVKNYATLIFRTIIILFPITIFLLGCQKKEETPIPSPSDEDSIALLTSFKHTDGSNSFDSTAFEYDSQHRVIKMTSKIVMKNEGYIRDFVSEITYNTSNKIETIHVITTFENYIATYTYTGDLVTKITTTKLTADQTIFNYDINNNLISAVESTTGTWGGIDSMVYVNYVNGRPQESILYRKCIGCDTYLENKHQRYTYDADNNLIKTELKQTGGPTTWQQTDGYVYDLKFNFLPKFAFMGRELGNPNLDTKDIDTYIPNNMIRYSTCGIIITKSSEQIITITKSDAKGLPIELNEKYINYNCDGTTKNVEATTTLVYKYVKR